MSLEFDLEKTLKIKTTGRDDSNSNLTNYPYEATNYEILQELSHSNYFNKDDLLIDFGCGKGRVDFYLSYFNKIKTIGVEYDKRLYLRAMDNLNTAKSRNRISFVNSCASSYVIPIDASFAYFFNPFSIFILKQVLDNIRISLLSNNRNFVLFFYYPSDEYLTTLDNFSDLIHLEDIDCTSLFKKNDRREVISVYKFKKENINL